MADDKISEVPVMKSASKPSRFISIAITTLRGFAMGAADLVPGVSGGTVALLLGIYDRFIGAIRGIAAIGGRLLRGDISGARHKLAEADWFFVLPLGAGIVIAVFSLATLMENLLHYYPEEMAGVFTGLVLASLVTCYLSVERRTNQADSDSANYPRQAADLSTSATPLETVNQSNPEIAAAERVNNPLARFAPWELLLVAIVAAGVFALLGFSATPQSSPSLLVYLGAGALAICAMVLPGISGSFLLLIVGMYAALLAAVDDLAIAELLVFCLGAAIGLALFSTLLHRLLTNFRRPTTAVLLGLLLGSMRVLWPWPNGVGIISRDETEAIDGTRLDWPSLSQAWLPTLLALAAFALILTLPKIFKLKHLSCQAPSQ